MTPHTHELTHLFDQLGLPSDEKAIEHFLSQNFLRDDQKLHQADFLSCNQKTFIKESWNQDSDWCVPIDQLDTLLRQPRGLLSVN